MSRVAYVRVSTAEQNEARQREALASRNIEKWFIEKVSAKNTDRPEYQIWMICSITGAESRFQAGWIYCYAT